ncbi:MAG: hypothetical protein FJY54_05265 [Betaproteobacteria bacterium]|nr:hypothetical protein [Betaproteobacteria bacterium]
MLELFLTKTGAHAVACAHCIHALPDLLAHAIYFALGLNLLPTPLKERAVSSTTVIDILKRAPHHQILRSTLSSLCNDGNFKHVAALSNKAKHQGIVKPSLNEDMTGTRKDRHEIRFTAFQHSGKSFPEAKIAELLGPAYKLASEAIVKSGNEINRLYIENAV